MSKNYLDELWMCAVKQGYGTYTKYATYQTERYIGLDIKCYLDICDIDKELQIAETNPKTSVEGKK